MDCVVCYRNSDKSIIKCSPYKIENKTNKDKLSLLRDHEKSLAIKLRREGYLCSSMTCKLYKEIIEIDINDYKPCKIASINVINMHSSGGYDEVMKTEFNSFIKDKVASKKNIENLILKIIEYSKKKFIKVEYIKNTKLINRADNSIDLIIFVNAHNISKISNYELISNEERSKIIISQFIRKHKPTSQNDWIVVRNSCKNTFDQNLLNFDQSFILDYKNNLHNSLLQLNFNNFFFSGEFKPGIYIKRNYNSDTGLSKRITVEDIWEENKFIIMLKSQPSLKLILKCNPSQITVFEASLKFIQKVNKYTIFGYRNLKVENNKEFNEVYACQNYVSLINKNLFLKVQPECYIKIPTVNNWISSIFIQTKIGNISNNLTSQIINSINLNCSIRLNYISDDQKNSAFICAEFPKTRMRTITSDPYGITLALKAGYSFKDEYRALMKMHLLYNKLENDLISGGSFQCFYLLQGSLESPKFNLEVLSGILSNAVERQNSLKIVSNQGSVIRINFNMKKIIKKKLVKFGICFQLNSLRSNFLGNGLIIMPTLVIKL